MCALGRKVEASSGGMIRITTQQGNGRARAADRNEGKRADRSNDESLSRSMGLGVHAVLRRIVQDIQAISTNTKRGLQITSSSSCAQPLYLSISATFTTTSNAFWHQLKWNYHKHIFHTSLNKARLLQVEASERK